MTVVVQNVTGNAIVDTMAAFWRAMSTAEHAETCVVRIPSGTPLDEPMWFERLVNYISECSDCCSSLGDEVVLLTKHPALQNSDRFAPSPELVLVRRVGGKNAAANASEGASAGWSVNKHQDGVWDDGDGDGDDDDDWDIDLSILNKYKEQDDAAEAAEKAAVGEVPSNDEVVLAKTFAWVQAVVVELGVCPFTSSSAARAGVPMGEVRYAIDRAESAEYAYAAYWREVQTLLAEQDERALSTTLLIVPNFCHASADGFDAFSATLTSALTSFALEKELQLVFFHPRYCFRDGASRFGAESAVEAGAVNDEQDFGAANYARRSPWGMINLLRTPQVRAAQRVIPTGLVYRQNERTLQEVGSAQLEAMLQKRDWKPLAARAPVDRRSNPVFAAADAFRQKQEQQQQ